MIGAEGSSDLAPLGRSTDDLRASTSTSLGSVHDLLQWLRDEPVEDDDLPPGPPRIGRFELRDELGRGTFGVVLRVFDPVLEHERAMKVPVCLDFDDPTSRAVLLREVKFVAAIDHPNVVRVFEADDLGGLCYLVMEYCPEGSLDSWLSRRGAGRPVPERWAARLMARIADGVHDAHARGILHRDLKPGNILLAREGTGDAHDPPEFCPKVADFGLAWTLEAIPGAAVEGGTVGTLAYMPPEQARGPHAGLGPTSDVYALGAILFELLAGRRVYETRGDREALRAALLSDRPSPSPNEFRPGLSRDLAVVCRTALEKDPRRRYASAAELADDLRRVARGEAVRGSPWWKRAWSTARRHRRAIAAVALVVAAGLAWAEARRSARLGAWLVRVDNARPGTLPGIVDDREDPTDARVATALRERLSAREPGPRLAAAVLLAEADPDAASIACEALLEAKPEDVGPIAVALDRSLPGLRRRLDRAAGGEGKGGGLRRANAATALAVLDDSGWAIDLLRWRPDPEARSHLIHTLGPAGFGPTTLLDALATTADPSTRAALLLAIGEVPESAWELSPGRQNLARDEALRLYRDDPASGVHGAAKWLLSHWEEGPRMAEVDATILGLERPGFSWRIHRSGLTLVLWRDPATGRLLEIADTETTVAAYREIVRDDVVPDKYSPSDDSPVTRMNYRNAIAFCNRFTAKHEGPDADLCYEPGPNGLLTDRAGIEDRSGFRLLTEDEFEAACLAGVVTPRPYGSCDELLGRYAWHRENSDRTAHPVVALKPNDLGLFGLLGNAYEICRSTVVPYEPDRPAIYRGASSLQAPSSHIVAHRSLSRDLAYPNHAEDDPFPLIVGFRVARTVPEPLRRTAVSPEIGRGLKPGPLEEPVPCPPPPIPVVGSSIPPTTRGH